MKTLLPFLLLSLGLVGCGDNTPSSSSSAQPSEQGTAQSNSAMLEGTVGDVQLKMPVYLCTGAGFVFDLGAAVNPDRVNMDTDSVGITAMEYPDAAGRSLEMNVQVNFHLVDTGASHKDIWASETIDRYQHDGDEVSVAGSAVGERYRLNPDGTHALEAPQKVDGGKSKVFQITAQCPGS